ncbi:MAG TPA: PspC domain-containing protein [candidate division Zixibacteria bacterium]|nr:PspC domain-containing protein [candidate division Zixibacteria bacterium]
MSLYCPNCGTANEEFAQYCASCGEDLTVTHTKKGKAETSTPQPESSTVKEEKKLLRSRTNKMITGLSAGLARYFDMDVDLVRLLWIIAFAITGGTVILVYFIMALAIPLEPEVVTT